MIDTHHLPAPGGSALPSPPQPWQPAEAARAAAGVEAVFAGPDGQLVQQRWQEAADMVCQPSGRHAVFVPAGLRQRLRGLIKCGLRSTGQGALFPVVGGSVVRCPWADHAR